MKGHSLENIKNCACVCAAHTSIHMFFKVLRIVVKYAFLSIISGLVQQTTFPRQPLKPRRVNYDSGYDFQMLP